MANPIDIVTAISEAIKEVSGLIRELISGAEVRRLQYRVEAGMNYVFVRERVGQYKDITDKKREELLTHFRKRIFDEK